MIKYIKCYVILYSKLEQYKDLDLLNISEPSNKQISTFTVVQFDNEVLALKILSLFIDYRVDLNFKDALK